jgi:hypothetical protein
MAMEVANENTEQARKMGNLWFIVVLRIRVDPLGGGCGAPHPEVGIMRPPSVESPLLT